MTEENKFQKNLLKENNSNNSSNNNESSNFTDSEDPVVPDDENIDERFRCLDEVKDHFRDEQLLGPNTYRSVENTAELAKKGKINLSKTKDDKDKSKSRDF